MSNFAFDDSRWPILVVRYTGVLTLDELNALLNRLTAYVDRKEPMVAIHDTSTSVLFPTRRTGIISNWICAHEDTLREFNRGTAFIINSTAQRYGLTAMLWTQSPPNPIRVCASVDDALRWGVQMLKLEGVPLPPLLASVPSHIPPSTGQW